MCWLGKKIPWKDGRTSHGPTNLLDIHFPFNSDFLSGLFHSMLPSRFGHFLDHIFAPDFIDFLAHLWNLYLFIFLSCIFICLSSSTNHKLIWHMKTVSYFEGQDFLSPMAMSKYDPYKIFEFNSIRFSFIFSLYLLLLCCLFFFFYEQFK